MKCRRDIVGRKIWNDNDNLYNTRPDTVTVNLFQNGLPISSTILASTGSQRFRFRCLLKNDEMGNQYIYTVDEEAVPAGYIKTIDKFNITNTLESITITGSKIWVDDNNIGDTRPVSINVQLLQNGLLFDTLEVQSPPDDQDTATFIFNDVPFANAEGVPFVYSVDEDLVAGYLKQIDGFNITNTLGIGP